MNLADGRRLLCIPTFANASLSLYNLAETNEVFSFLRVAILAFCPLALCSPGFDIKLSTPSIHSDVRASNYPREIINADYLLSRVQRVYIYSSLSSISIVQKILRVDSRITRDARIIRRIGKFKFLSKDRIRTEARFMFDV